MTGQRELEDGRKKHISEGRLTNGWHSYDEIQRLRMTISQTKPLQAHQASASRDQYNYKRPNQGPQQGSDMLRRGPPCPAYNSSAGCNLNSGHISNGKRMIHVCAFCLHNTSAVNPHPEVQCRNKIRLTGSNTSSSHFH